MLAETENPAGSSRGAENRINGAGQRPDYLSEFELIYKMPASVDAEQALLGALLLDGDTYQQVAGDLRPEHFSEDLHAEIYSAIERFAKQGKRADPLTLKPLFDHHDDIVPGLSASAYLARLVGGAASLRSVKSYAETIKDLAARRELLEVGKGIVRRASEPEIDVPLPAIISDAMAELGRASTTHAPEDVPFEARCLADIQPEPVQWLWPRRLALGKLNLIAGDPGLGKSQLTLAMAATVTTGGTWPDGSRAPQGNVILISCEDEAGDTIRPRLDAAGADVRRVHTFDWVRTQDRNGAPVRAHFDVAEHMGQLEDLVRRIGDVRLIVIDPVTAFLGRADSHKTADVRQALAPMQALLAEHGIAGLLVSHLNKGEGPAMNRVTGSGAFVAVARSAWVVGKDKQDPDGVRRILTPLKNNVGDDRTGFAFRLEAAHLPNDILTSRVVFDSSPVFVEADDVIGRHTSADRGPSAFEEACEFLKVELAEGAQPARKVEKTAEEAGIAKITLRRAREKLCRTRKTSFGWVWELIESHADDA